jgi:hypothetical protein
MATTLPLPTLSIAPAAWTPMEGRLAWHASAPRRVARSVSWDDGSAGWGEWAGHLARRRTVDLLGGLASDGRNPLLWNVPESLDDGDLGELVAGLWQLEHARSAAEVSRDGSALDLADRLRAWLAEADHRAASVPYAFSALAWCHAAPALARLVPARLWWELVEHLVQTAEDARRLARLSDPLVWQLLAGELPLTLAALFAEIKNVRCLAKGGRREVSSGVFELVDSSGLPKAGLLPLVRPLLACWTRCRILANRAGRGQMDKTTARRLRLFLQAALRLARKDGSQVLTPGAAGAYRPDAFAATLAEAGCDTERHIADLVLPARRGKDTSGAIGLPEPALHSEPCGLALMRVTWPAGSPSLTIHYGEELAAELTVGRDVLLAGRLDPQIRIDGAPCLPTGRWTSTFWTSDDDLDYLELDLPLSHGWRVQRHLALGRSERFLLLADAVLGERPGRVDYLLTLPTCPGVGFEPEPETHDGLLVGRKPRAWIAPLGLPEWRSEPSRGSLTTTAEGLELRQSADGQGLVAGLWLDLDRRRLAAPHTWRRLMVAEGLRPVGPDRAAGFRIQAGVEHWVVYRALVRANRTVLGVNTVNEFLLGRIGVDGNVERLIEIEG